MSFPAYPAYQESGISWIGPVPAGWAVKRLRFLAQVQTGIAKGKDVQGIETIRVPYLRVANVQDGFIDIDDVSEIEIAATDLGRYLLRPGDVLMNEGGDFDKLGRGQVWNGAIDPCIHQNHVFAVRPHGIEPEWLALVTSADCGRFFFMSRAKQSTNLASISSTNLLELPLPCPPPAERRAIMRFLDRETGKIDALVAEQERLIALLKEKRQAVISQAVTKGLDPNAPMKPSGVAWLGEVPAHWELRKLATALRESPCYGVLVPDFESDGVPMLRITDVTDGHADRETLTTISPSLSAQYQRTIVQAGDVAISVVGTIGEAIRIDASLAGVNLSRALARLQPTDNLSADFLCFLVQSEFFKCFVDLVCVGTAQRVLNMSALASLSIALPPIEEQVAIAGNLEGALARLSQLTSEAERAITLLRERRAALISAAVTGKIDVRGAVPGAQEAA